MNCHEPETMARVDAHLSAHWDVRPDYFDSYLKACPASTFFMGMKVYATANKENFTALESELSSFQAMQKKEDEYILLAKSRLLELQGKETEARSAINNAIRISPRNKWCLLQKYKLGDKEALSAILKSQKNFYRANVYLAFTLDASSDCSTIIELLETIPQSLQTNDIKTFLGDAQYFCGDSKAAIISYNQALKIKEDANAYLGLATIAHNVNKDFSAAEQYYNRAFQLEPQLSAIQFGLGWLAFDKGNANAAEQYFRNGMRLGGSEEHFEDIIRFYILTGDTKKAEHFVSEMSKKFGRSYKTEGFSYILHFYQYNETQRREKLRDYHAEFGMENLDWLSRTIEELGL